MSTPNTLQQQLQNANSITLLYNASKNQSSYTLRYTKLEDAKGLAAMVYNIKGITFNTLDIHKGKLIITFDDAQKTRDAQLHDTLQAFEDAYGQENPQPATPFLPLRQASNDDNPPKITDWRSRIQAPRPPDTEHTNKTTPPGMKTIAAMISPAHYTVLCPHDRYFVIEAKSNTLLQPVQQLLNAVPRLSQYPVQGEKHAIEIRFDENDANLSTSARELHTHLQQMAK